MSRLSHRSRSAPIPVLDIPAKANRLLNLIMIVLVLYSVRIWHLTVIQYDDRVEDSRKPQRRVIIERAERATIRDRFNIPLAINQVQYNAAISYAQIREVPAIIWRKNENGVRVKTLTRKAHITNLSKVLAKELSMNAERIEDIIHSKAALLYNAPFIIKEDISEKEYYRLKMLEKDWLGIHVERMPRRFYPQGKTAGDVVGYIGPISRSQYDAVLLEIQCLEEIVKAKELGEPFTLPIGMETASEAIARLKDLQERAYTISDCVGKAGVEAMYDAQLRGYRGKKTYYSDIRGNFLRELPGSKEPLSGQRYLLTISSELQEYAERLLTIAERLRDNRCSVYNRETGTHEPVKQPWIKGGAIVAIDPNNGEVLAMASHPRFDPNDFIATTEGFQDKQLSIKKWLETDGHISDLWDRKKSLERENFVLAKGEYANELQTLTWDSYLATILPKDNQVRLRLAQFNTVLDSIVIQKALETIEDELDREGLQLLIKTLPDSFNSSTQDGKLAYRHLQEVLTPLKTAYNRFLFLDLLRVAVDHHLFYSHLYPIVQNFTLSQHRESESALAMIEDIVKKMAKDLYRDHTFSKWRTEHQDEYLKEKREEEKLRKLYKKPFIDYLDRKENELFSAFWQENRSDLLTMFLLGKNENTIKDELSLYQRHFQTWQQELSSGAHAQTAWNWAYHHLNKMLSALSLQQAADYLQTLRSYDQLNRPLLTRYSGLKNEKNFQLEKHLAAAFYPQNGYGYVRSQAYRQVASQGSIFKLVTTYASLMQESNGEKAQSPFTIVDDLHRSPGKKGWNVGYTTDKKPIPQIYKGGRLPRSAHAHIGQIDLVGALETSSNPYFSILAGEVIDDPQKLIDAAKSLGYGSKTGIDLPGESSGHLPDDLHTNKTGLYAFAIGHHSLTCTPLQTAVMVSAIANGGNVVKPKIVHLTAGKEPIRGSALIYSKDNFAFKDPLELAGIDFPLFTAAEKEREKNLINYIPDQLARKIPLPQSIRQMMLQGMRQAVIGTRGTARWQMIRSFGSYPEALKDYKEIAPCFLGKTSTAEKVERIDMDEENGKKMINHIGFAAISFEDEVKAPFTAKPELIVIVYLRYGDYGKEAAPLAAQIVKKWREIKLKYSKK
ncbi:MAG: hypothetical protein JHC93_00895 [Parachlamydiales bacterium]|nr:hypothetical protein [Parachlamydiales bacterium]